MKKSIFFIASWVISLVAVGQTPQKINYQAVARDASGAILANRSVSIRFTIRDASTSGTSLFQETHSTTTNQFGQFSLAIGGGNLVSGNFSTINWAVNDKFLQVDLDANGGSNFVTMGTSQLLSVPYALHARTVSTGDNWGTQTTQTSNLLSGNGTSASPLTIVPSTQNYRKLITDGSGNVTWSTFGGHSIYKSGAIANAATTWDIIDFSTTQFGQLCSNCNVIIRFYSPVNRTLYVRFPNDPNPVENVYDIAAGRSVIVGVQALNGQIQYYSNTAGQIKYEFMGFYR